MKNGMFVKLGFVTIASSSRVANMGKEISLTKEMINEFKYADVVQADEIVTSWQQAEETVKKLKKEDIDILLVQLLTYAGDELTVKIVSEINIPVLFWGVPEPLLKGNIKSGGLVGYVQTAGVLSKLDYDYKFLWGSPGDKKVVENIKTTVKVYEVVKKLRQSRIGFLGSRCPGMMDEAFHELELTRLIGPEVLTLDLADLVKKIRETKDAMVKEEFNDVVNKHGRLEGTSENDLVEALKIYKALKGIAEDYSFQAMAVKCWPELMNSGIMSPCLALSKLNDDGIMTACEGDVTAAATMLILYYLTGKQVFLCDLFEMNEADNSYFMYHCGAAPSKLAEKSSDVQLNIHFRKYKPLTPMVLKPGVIADFAIKPGKVTFARLTEKKGKYRLLIMEGEAVPQENLIGGNGMRVKMNGKVKTILERMVREGIEHHQLVVHAEIKKELVELCGFLGIEPLLIEG